MAALGDIEIGFKSRSKTMETTSDMREVSTDNGRRLYYNASSEPDWFENPIWLPVEISEDPADSPTIVGED